MRTVHDVFEALGGIAGYATALGIPYQTAAAQHRRESIPAEYWPEVARAGHAVGHVWITVEVLAAMAKPRKRKPAEAAA